MIAEHRQTFGTSALCKALGEPRSTWYRTDRVRHLAEVVPPTPRTPSPRKLHPDEEQRVLDLLHSERFMDVSPGEVHATVLDEGRYICSERSMYRILERNHETTQRRQREPRLYACPELLATRPNQVWSWDITKLKGPAKWMYFYLYKILDIFSRYVVGWMIALRELAYLAETLIAESCRKQGILPDQLTLHADRGSPMTSNVVGQLLVGLGVNKSHSRPYVSNDNPFSESAFKTLKYRPDFPERFCSIEDARQFCHTFFAWYNTEHRHSGIEMLTPETVHYGREQHVLIERQKVLSEAFERNPERFVRGVPVVKQLPNAVYINPPKPSPSGLLIVR